MADGKPAEVKNDAVESTETSGEPDFSKKHQLDSSWTFWFDNPNGRSKQVTWGGTLRQVYTFGSIEEFWGMYNNVVTPSKLVHGADFHIFRDGVEPKWEDPKCANGGKWNVLISNSTAPAQKDAMWLNLVLAMIGEQFAENDEICGAVVSVRNKQDRIALWTKTAANEAMQINIGRQLKQFLELSDNTRIGYMVHADAIKNDRKAKERYSI